MAKYCSNCGKEIAENQAVCLNCGVAITGGSQNANAFVDPNAKSKLVAGLLGIFLGAFGIHNFYLGFTGKAIAQLLLTCVGWLACGIGPAVAAVWGLIEGILVLCGNITADATGRQLRD